MIERASAKRRLEALVIGQGNYRTSLDDIQDVLSGGGASGTSSKAAGLAAQILADEMQDQATRAAEGKGVKVLKPGEEPISQEQLDLLLDRSVSRRNQTRVARFFQACLGYDSRIV